MAYHITIRFSFHFFCRIAEKCGIFFVTLLLESGIGCKQYINWLQQNSKLVASKF